MRATIDGLSPSEINSFLTALDIDVTRMKSEMKKFPSGRADNQQEIDSQRQKIAFDRQDMNRKKVLLLDALDWKNKHGELSQEDRIIHYDQELEANLRFQQRRQEVWASESQS